MFAQVGHRKSKGLERKNWYGRGAANNTRVTLSLYVLMLERNHHHRLYVVSICLALEHVVLEGSV